MFTNSLIPIRDENPTRTTSWLTIALIAINVVVFLQEPSFGSPPNPVDPGSVVAYCQVTAFFYRWGVVPKEITGGSQAQISLRGCPSGTEVGKKNVYLSLLTSLFLHGGFLHIAGNMLFLWIFGNNVEDRLGKLKFLIFYLLCGVAASLAHSFVNPNAVVPSVGASGAIAGILGAYIVLFPRARVVSLVPIFFFFQFMRIPAYVFLLIWFFYQFLIGGSQSVGGGGVAWMAHVGGFITGALLIIPFGGRPRRAPPQSFTWEG